MRTAREVRALAEELGAQPDTTEKIVLLLALLDRLQKDERTRAAWVLKGGTALHVFHLDLPRLSVDIDLDFTGALSKDEMLRLRPEFEKGLERCCMAEGCRVRRAPSEHAGGKFRLSYTSAFGGEQRLEIDVSYVARVPLHGSEPRVPTLPALAGGAAVPTLVLEELAAGKVCALLGRGAARDHYDLASLIDSRPEALEGDRFRTALACFVAVAREDLRERKRPAAELSRNEVRTQLVPVLRRRDGKQVPDVDELLTRISERTLAALERLTAWSAGERRFLDRLLDAGELEPEHLTSDAALAERIRSQPMLQWKRENVRTHRPSARAPRSG